MKGYLLLSDGSLYEGTLIGNQSFEVGEIVFNTSMTGYQEILTDPSYYGQMVVLTYPLIGNYGVELSWSQSEKIQAKGLIVRELCENPSHWAAEFDLNSYLKANGTTGLTGVDTRAITKKLRTAGTMNGCLLTSLDQKEEALKAIQNYVNQDGVFLTSTPESYGLSPEKSNGLRVAVLDFGIKKGILKALLERGFELKVFPAHTKSGEIMSWNPDGIFLSNGPGDPADLGGIIAEIEELLSYKPIFGICLGHQLLCHAFGGKTEKLKFGHRGGNHPVMDLNLGKVFITSQNHGYVVVDDSLDLEKVAITHYNVNDGSIEGMKHKKLPIFSVQYHPEASPGPNESEYLFDQFKTLIENHIDWKEEKYA